MKRQLLIGAAALAGLVLLAVIWDNSDPQQATNESQRGTPDPLPEAAAPERSGRKTQLAPPVPVPAQAAVNIPEHLEPIIENWSEVPDYALVERLTKADLDVLVACYQQETNLLKRRSLTVALALAQDERAVGLFQRTLTTEFHGKRLESGSEGRDNEETVIMITLHSMGLLGTKYDTALEFLKQGIDPIFWREEAGWISHDSADLYGTLAGNCVVAIAVSGRPEVPAFLESFRHEPLTNTADSRIEIRRTLEGAVVDAAFRYDMIQERGTADYHSRVFRTDVDELYRLFQQWSKTDRGKAWRAWSKQRRGIPW